MAVTVINQVPWDFANISYQFDLFEWNGPGQIRLLSSNLPLGTACREFNYSGKIETEDMMGSSRQAQDTTDGVGMYEGSFVLEEYGADKLDEIIASIGGHGVGTVRLCATLIFAKPGIPPFAHVVYMARIIGDEAARKGGKEGLSRQYTLKPFRIFKRGKDLFGEPLT